MKPLGDARTHYWLAKRMAGLHAVDLARAARQGDLDQVTWAGLVQRCRGCDWTAGCERYLSRGEVTPEAGAVWPEGCPNRAVFASLKAIEELEENP